MRGDNLQDVGRRDRLVIFRQKILERFARELDRDAISGERGECHDAIQMPLELADVGTYSLGDEQRDVVRQIEFLLLRFLAEDGHFRFEIGRLDVGNQAPLES